MNTSDIMLLPISIILMIVVSMAACSPDSNIARYENQNLNQNRVMNNPRVVTSTPSPQTSKQYINEQLFKRLDKIIASEYGETESPENLSAISSLLEQGADVAARNSVGQTPLLEAAQNGHIKAMEMFLNKGADINAQDDRGDTALMAAAGTNDVKMVKLLLAKGANVNIKNKVGFTALSGSEMVGGSSDPRYLEIRRLLKRAGAR